LFDVKLENDDDIFEITKKLQKNLDVNELKALQDALQNTNPKSLNEKTLSFYEEINKTNGKGKEFNLLDGQIHLLPNKNSRECIYAAGPSGSGKSTWVSNYVEEWRKMFPNEHLNPIVLFSRVTEDEALDRFNPLRIGLNEDLIYNPVDLTELENSLCIFDDIDQLSNTNKLRDIVINLRDQILEEGRHKKIYCCTTSHLITNHKATRVPLNEASHVVFYPRSGAARAIKYFLQIYVGLDKDQINNIMNLPSRWVCIKKTYPIIVIHQTGCFLI
jgi:hypothetical protein